MRPRAGNGARARRPSVAPPRPSRTTLIRRRVGSLAFRKPPPPQTALRIANPARRPGSIETHESRPEAQRRARVEEPEPRAASRLRESPGARASPAGVSWLSFPPVAAWRVERRECYIVRRPSRAAPAPPLEPLAPDHPGALRAATSSSPRAQPHAARPGSLPAPAGRLPILAPETTRPPSARRSSTSPGAKTESPPPIASPGLPVDSVRISVETTSPAWPQRSTRKSRSGHVPCAAPARRAVRAAPAARPASMICKRRAQLRAAQPPSASWGGRRLQQLRAHPRASSIASIGPAMKCGPSGGARPLRGRWPPCRPAACASRGRPPARLRRRTAPGPRRFLRPSAG